MSSGVTKLIPMDRRILTGKLYEESDNQETITAGKSEANPANLKVALLPAPQVDGSVSSKVPMMTTVPNTKEPFTGIV